MEIAFCSNVFHTAVVVCKRMKEGVMIMWNLGGTLKGVWEESNPPCLIRKNHLDHNTKLTVFLCCFSLAILGEVFGTRYGPVMEQYR